MSPHISFDFSIVVLLCLCKRGIPKLHREMFTIATCLLGVFRHFTKCHECDVTFAWATYKEALDVIITVPGSAS